MSKKGLSTFTILLSVLIILFLGIPNLNDLNNEKLGVWSRMDNQNNILECINTSQYSIIAELSIFDNQSQLLNKTKLKFKPHSNLNFLLDKYTQVNSLGTLSIKVIEGDQSLECHSVFYKFKDSEIIYSYSVPVIEPVYGSTYGLFNNLNPSGLNNNPTENWLTIYNSSTSNLNGELLIFDIDGKTKKRIAIDNLEPRRRINFNLKDEPVGLYEIKPKNNDLKYGSFLTRYNSSRVGAYDNAYTLLSLAGSGKTSKLNVSTISSTQNWLEIANISNYDQQVEVITNEYNSNKNARQIFNLKAKSQKHISIDNFLSLNSSGTASISCISKNCSEGSLITQSLFYGIDKNLKWAYATQGTPLTNAISIYHPINTNISIYNWAKIISSSQSNLTFYNEHGQIINTLRNTKLKDIDINKHTSSNFIGIAKIENADLSELLRINLNTQGQISNINLIRSNSVYEKSFNHIRKNTELNNPLPTNTIANSPTPTFTPTAQNTPTPSPTPNNEIGPLKGQLEFIKRENDSSYVIGWACRTNNSRPVRITLKIGNEIIGSEETKRQRSDIKDCINNAGFKIQLSIPSKLEYLDETIKAIAEDDRGSIVLELVNGDKRLLAGDIYPLLGNQFPKAINFRLGLENNPRPDIYSNTDKWLNDLSLLNGGFSKAANEELGNLDTNTAKKALDLISSKEKQFAAIHYNGVGILPTSTESKIFEPLDWLYYPGCDSSSSFNENENSIKLPMSCFEKFRKCIKGPHSGEPEAPSCFPENLLALKRNPNGSVDWSTFEYLIVEDLKKISTNLFEIVVKRAQFDSIKKTYPHKVYLAPISSNGPWQKTSSQILWNYNFTRQQTRTNVVNVIKNQFNKIPSLDAITLDISYWNPMPSDRKVDSNFDGVADNGFINGINNYAKGLVEFHKELKQAIGKDKLVLADGADKASRDFHILNGSENEGFSGPRDGNNTSWSTGLEYLTYGTNRTSRPHLKYVVNKNMPKVKNMRLAMAAETISGAAIGNINSPKEFFEWCTEEEWQKEYNRNGVVVFDELVGGRLNKKQWLGSPLETINRPVFSATPVHPSSKEDLRSLITSNDANINHLSDRTVINPNANKNSFKIQISGLNANSESDYTLFFDIKSEGVLDGFESDLKIPRIATVTSNSTFPKSEDGEVMQSSELQAPFGNTWSRAVFFFRNNESRNNLIFTINFEGTKPISIRNIKFVHATDILMRRYENGLVIANPSLRKVNIDLSKYYPILYPGQPFKRITNTFCQARLHNDGRVEDKVITLNGQDGLFLINNEQEKHADIYILAGQSNSLGASRKEEITQDDNRILFAYKYLKGSIRNYNNLKSDLDNEDNWVKPDTLITTLKPQFGRGGVEFNLSRKLLDSELCGGKNCREKSQLVLIKYGAGSSNLFNDWLGARENDADLLGRLFIYINDVSKELRNKGYAPRFRGLIWIQGESDTATLESSRSYYDNLNKFISRIRSFLSDKKLKIAIAELRDTWPTSEEGKEKARIIKSAQHQTAAEDDSVIVIPTDGLRTKPDEPIHYNQEGLDELGLRTFYGFLKLN